jgi:hypothetical protein
MRLHASYHPYRTRGSRRAPLAAMYIHAAQLPLPKLLNSSSYASRRPKG